MQILKAIKKEPTSAATEALKKVREQKLFGHQETGQCGSVSNLRLLGCLC